MLGEISRLAFTLADARTTGAITAMCKPPTSVPGSAHTWWDTRPMLSTDERSPDSVEQCRLVLLYGDYRRLFVRHPEQTHLVRLVSPK
jgi:hypothetical protein